MMIIISSSIIITTFCFYKFENNEKVLKRLKRFKYWKDWSKTKIFLLYTHIKVERLLF